VCNEGNDKEQLAQKESQDDGVIDDDGELVSERNKTPTYGERKTVMIVKTAKKR